MISCFKITNEIKVVNVITTLNSCKTLSHKMKNDLLEELRRDPAMKLLGETGDLRNTYNREKIFRDEPLCSNKSYSNVLNNFVCKKLIFPKQSCLRSHNPSVLADITDITLRESSIKSLQFIT